MILLLLFTVSLDSSTGKIVKGFHFNPLRRTDYQIPIGDMVDHANNNQSSWVFNFTGYGNCVRANKEPFKMPRKLTFCWKHNHDYFDGFNFINLVGTSHGKSILEDFAKNVTWNKMRGQHRMINYLLLNRNFYGSLWHTVHNINGQSNGLAQMDGVGSTWYEWEHWCVAINFEEGQAISYVNGVKDGDTVAGDPFWLNPLNEANKFSFEDDLVTDVLFGCNFFNLDFKTCFRSLGKSTEYHLFDRILSVNEMIGMTTCGGEKLQGNLINFSTDKFTVFGGNTREIEISTEEWCPTRKFSATSFPAAWSFLSKDARAMCKKVKRTVIAVTDEETKDNFLHYLTYMGNGLDRYEGYVVSNVEKNPSAPSGWADPVTGNDSIIPWMDNQPMDVPGYVWTMFKTYDYYKLGIMTREAVHDGRGGIAFCVSKDPSAYRFKVKILGLCWSSLYDYRYTYNYENRHTYIGKGNSTIQYRDGENWIFTSKTDREDWNRKGPFETLITPAHITGVALGTHYVSMPDDLCTKGQDDKMVRLTITACEDTEFTCFDGNCVPFEQRCNRIEDCPDSSDERDCLILKLDKTTYIKDYPPVTVDDNYDLIKVPVNISLDILDILDINEVEGQFEVSFELHQTWYDDRHVYVNLKEEADLNTLTSSEKDDIWKPFIVFSNTKTQETVVTDDKVMASIGKLGEHKAGDRTEAIRSYYFKGAENTITFSRIYDIGFICDYNMAWYPFDVQRCEITLQPFGNTGKYISLVRDNMQYLGELDLSKYYIKQWKFVAKDTDTGDGVEGNYSTTLKVICL